MSLVCWDFFGIISLLFIFFPRLFSVRITFVRIALVKFPNLVKDAAPLWAFLAHVLIVDGVITPSQWWPFCQIKDQRRRGSCLLLSGRTRRYNSAWSTRWGSSTQTHDKKNRAIKRDPLEILDWPMAVSRCKPSQQRHIQTCTYFTKSKIIRTSALL